MTILSFLTDFNSTVVWIVSRDSVSLFRLRLHFHVASISLGCRLKCPYSSFPSHFFYIFSKLLFGLLYLHLSSLVRLCFHFPNFVSNLSSFVAQFQIMPQNCQLSRCGCVNTTVWMHHLNANDTPGEKARQELHQNATCYFGNIPQNSCCTAAYLPSRALSSNS